MSSNDDSTAADFFTLAKVIFEIGSYILAFLFLLEVSTIFALLMLGITAIVNISFMKLVFDTYRDHE